jgi:multiple sugar transport system ATP-binding protein
MNLLDAEIHDGHAIVGGHRMPVDRGALAKATGAVTIGVRPESFRVVDAGQEGIPVTVTLVEELGADAYVYGTSGVEGTPSSIVIRVPGQINHVKGSTIRVTTDSAAVHLFDTTTGIRLSA